MAKKKLKKDIVESATLVVTPKFNTVFKLSRVKSTL